MHDKLMAWQRLLLPLYDTPSDPGLGNGPAKKTEPPPKQVTSPADEGDDDDDDDIDDGPRKPSPYEKRLRTENKKRREEIKRLTTLVDELQKRPAAMTADEIARKAEERAQAMLAEARQAGDKRIIRSTLKAELKAAGAHDVDAALTLIDASAIKINDDGDIEGLADAIKGLKEKKAYLFGDGRQSTSNPDNPPKPKLPEGKKATEMTPEEYAALRRQFSKTTTLRRAG